MVEKHKHLDQQRVLHREYRAKRPHPLYADAISSPFLNHLVWTVKKQELCTAHVKPPLTVNPLLSAHPLLSAPWKRKRLISASLWLATPTQENRCKWEEMVFIWAKICVYFMLCTAIGLKTSICFWNHMNFWYLFVRHYSCTNSAMLAISQ